MYSEIWVGRRLDAAQRLLAPEFLRLGFPRYQLTYHTVSEVDQFDSALRDSAKLDYDERGNVIGTRNLNAEEILFILNEQTLVKCDAAYALTRYCKLIDEEGVIMRFTFRLAQRLLFGVISDLESLDVAIEIMILKARQLGMCLIPKTLVLTADLTWKPIDDVKVGDELVSVDENPMPREGAKALARRMRTAKVQARMERVHRTIEMTLSTGRTITATPEHPFLCLSRSNGAALEWRKTGNIKVGDKIRRIVEPWDDADMEDAWLGGLIDGEGCLRQKDGAGVELSVSQVEGDVLNRARRLMLERYVQVREEVDRRKGGESSKLGNKPVHKLVVGRLEALFKLLGRTRPTRFKNRRWWEDRELPGKRLGDQWAVVTAIRDAGEQRVVNIQTETGTFIAEGVVSHNTTIVQLLILLRIVFGHGVNAVAASAEKEKSGLMAKKLFMAYDYLPVWLRPQATARSEEGDQPKLVFGQLNTTLSVQHGKKMSGGVAQGWTPTIYHISEVALMPDANSQINMGLWKAVHASANVLGILESSGAGDVGWWADTWKYSKEHWARRECRMCPVFLPWFIGREIYPKAAWLRMRPVPSGWFERRLPATREHVGRAELYVRTEPILRRYLGERWSMPLEQQWFWEVGHQEALATGTESTWFQEMAGDDTEALQRSTEGVFPHEVMVEVEDRARPTQAAMKLYSIIGQSIEDRHEPASDDIDYGTPSAPAERIPIRWRSPRSETVFRWELVPIRHSAERLDQVRGRTAAFRGYGDCRLIVFHPPQRGVRYTIGGDTGGGGGADSTVFSVMAIGRDGSPDVQVAEFRSAFVSHVEAYAFAMPIAAWYGQFALDSGSPDASDLSALPLISIEQLKAVGDVCQSEMRKMGYPLGRFFDFGRYDGRKLKQIGNRKGWYTTGWSRPILCGNFVNVVRNGWCVINSPWTIEEMRNWERHYTATGMERLEHSESYWDDGIFASGIATFTSHDMESQTERTKKKYQGMQLAQLPPIDVRSWEQSSGWSTKVDPARMITDINDL